MSRASCAIAVLLCVWVIWRNEVIYGPAVPRTDSWHYVGTAATESRCDHYLTKLVTGLAEPTGPGHTWTKTTEASVQVQIGRNTLTWYFYCIPDTIDPRGPKK